MIDRSRNRVALLAAAVAHDFNEELTMILSQVDASLDLLEPEHPAAGQLAELERSAQRCAGITRELLAYSRRLGAKPRGVPLSRLLHD